MTDIHPIDFMAMWEAFLDARTEAPDTALCAVWDACGSVAMRVHAMTVTKAADALWRSLSDEDQCALAPFDWEFCPRYLALITWQGDGRYTEFAPECPTLEAARAALFTPARETASHA